MNCTYCDRKLIFHKVLKDSSAFYQCQCENPDCIEIINNEITFYNIYSLNFHLKGAMGEYTIVNRKNIDYIESSNDFICQLPFIPLPLNYSSKDIELLDKKKFLILLPSYNLNLRLIYEMPILPQ